MLRYWLPVLLAVAGLTLSGCDSVVVPPADGASLSHPTTASAVASSYTAVLLPGGVVGDHVNARLRLEDGAVYGSIVPEGASTETAVRWSIGPDGAVAGPDALGALPEPYDVSDQKVRASNGAGVVVGVAQNVRGEKAAGWLWTGSTGVMTLLPEPTGGAETVITNDVSLAGVVVGQVRLYVEEVLETHPALWLPPYDGPPTLLPRPEGIAAADPTYATAVSDEATGGTVVTGVARGSADALVRWRVGADGAVVSAEVVAGGAGILPPNAGANDALDVVGSAPSDGSGPREAVLLWSGAAAPTALGPLGGDSESEAYGLAERAADGSVLVVGGSYPTRQDPPRAVVWGADDAGVGGAVDLGLPDPYPSNKPGDRFTAALAHSVNGAGWAAGWSLRSDGTRFATLWRPAGGGGDGSDPAPGGGPVASFTYDCASSPACQFTDTSTGGAVAWSWSFGDGATSSVQDPAHTYTSAGTYGVVLEVADADGRASTASGTIECSSHPRHGLRCK